MTARRKSPSLSLAPIGKVPAETRTFYQVDASRTVRCRLFQWETWNHGGWKAADESGYFSHGPKDQPPAKWYASPEEAKRAAIAQAHADIADAQALIERARAFVRELESKS